MLNHLFRTGRYCPSRLPIPAWCVRGKRTCLVLQPRALEVSWDEEQLTWVPDNCRTIWLKSTWDEVPALAVGRGVLIVTAVLLRTLD